LAVVLKRVIPPRNSASSRRQDVYFGRRGDGHIEFRKNANISVLNTDIFTQFHKDATQADYGQHLQDGFQPAM